MGPTAIMNDYTKNISDSIFNPGVSTCNQFNKETKVRLGQNVKENHIVQLNKSSNIINVMEGTLGTKVRLFQ